MLARQVLDQSNLGFGDLVCVNSRDPNTLLMNVEHDLDGLRGFFMEDVLKDLHHEFLRSIVVVMQQNLIEGGLF